MGEVKFCPKCKSLVEAYLELFEDHEAELNMMSALMLMTNTQDDLGKITLDQIGDAISRVLDRIEIVNHAFFETEMYRRHDDAVLEVEMAKIKARIRARRLKLVSQKEEK